MCICISLVCVCVYERAKEKSEYYDSFSLDPWHDQRMLIRHLQLARSFRENTSSLNDGCDVGGGGGNSKTFVDDSSVLSHLPIVIILYFIYCFTF